MKVNTARSVEEHFTYLTDMNGYLGEMTINHEEETINIRVVRRKGNDKSTANQEVRLDLALYFRKLLFSHKVKKVNILAIVWSLNLGHLISSSN